MFDLLFTIMFEQSYSIMWSNVTQPALVIFFFSPLFKFVL